GLFQRNHQPTEVGRGINISGVDFWHAVEFSRNGRFLCTHPQNILWWLSSGRFPFGLAFPTLSDSFVSDFLGAFQVSLSGDSDFIRDSESEFPALNRVVAGAQAHRLPVQAEM
ncbi:hypothetical protein, partial [Streptomyces beijiangensis]|uniref:hypothetical protein n=1 Tax=Streptomyces beijiangensis TaxID=163361 RepID=UPI0031DD2526